MPNQYKAGTVILAVRMPKTRREAAHQRAHDQGEVLSELVNRWVQAYAETGSPVRTKG